MFNKNQGFYEFLPADSSAERGGTTTRGQSPQREEKIRQHLTKAQAEQQIINFSNKITEKNKFHQK